MPCKVWHQWSEITIWQGDPFLALSPVNCGPVRLRALELGEEQGRKQACSSSRSVMPAGRGQPIPASLARRDTPPPWSGRPGAIGQFPDCYDRIQSAAVGLLRSCAWITFYWPWGPPAKLPRVPRLSRASLTSYVQFAVESLSSFAWNQYPVCRGMAVQFGVEYARLHLFLRCRSVGAWMLGYELTQCSVNASLPAFTCRLEILDHLMR